MNQPGCERLVLRSLRRLPTPAPDTERAERLRAHCHDQLADRARHRQRLTSGLAFARRTLAPALTGAICLLYAAAMIGNTLRVLGLL